MHRTICRAATTASCPARPRAVGRGRPRIYALASSSSATATAGSIARRSARFLCSAFQTVAPLTIGELWAWPSMLKARADREPRAASRDETLDARAARRAADAFSRASTGAGRAPRAPGPSRTSLRLPRAAPAAHARVRPAAAELCRARARRRLAAQGQSPEDAIRDEHQRAGGRPGRSGNAITSLRLCSTLDWSRSSRR